MSIFEAGMLICFGVAWPVSIYKSLTTKSVEGKSLLFMYIVVLGYISGVTHKLLYNMDIVFYLYLLNLLMVLFDMFLYYRNRKNSK